MKNSPNILLTVGDSNGIGPEIILKIMPFLRKNNFNVKIIGPERVFNYYSKRLKISMLRNEELINLPYDYKPQPGLISNISGKISGDAIAYASLLCEKRGFDAIITMPVSKQALNSGGYNFSGHTDMLKQYTYSKSVYMMMQIGNKTFIPLTHHIPLKDVPGKITKKYLIHELINIDLYIKRYFKIRNPKLALLSLNPHSGDGGVLGNEELKVIIPVINQLDKLNINIKGPYAVDGFFGSNKDSNFDCICGLYHDQILTPFKILSKDKGVNFTAGLPYIRTSPAHGTAFDISGKNRAKIESTIESIKLSVKLSLLNKKTGNV